ncbi:NALCN channel auxiliary factor 2 [Paramormyrops kingsleyae]|uniref:NALCN channel auxiliary factor 2 n=1 Tax=Paramormyrops kingsleyae TaxID=1676925 RepID=A0A3B3Q6W3_9TELE|nr:transmembrane protein FAM155B [Paramormyrops kingsleyae]
MIKGVWMYRRQDDALLKISCAPEQNDKPCADSERAQKWRMSLASLLFFTVLLSDHLWLCAGVKLRSRDTGDRQAQSNATDGDHLVGKCDIFLSNSTKPAAPSSQCTDAQTHQNLESACTILHLQKAEDSGSSFPSASSLSSLLLLAYFRNFSLSFCDSYTISDLLLGMESPDSLNCSLQNLIWDLGKSTGDDMDVCSTCIQAYMRLDQHAQEKYEEFDLFFLKYLSEDYSVKSRTEDCKLVYKAWLCSEYFNVTQRQCHHRIPCKQYCLEVQTRCPFVLPDNDDLVYGGLSSFICTESDSTGEEPECCDVRWNSCDPVGEGACNMSGKLPGTPRGQRRSSQPVSAATAPRPCGGSRLRFCVLVLILLHTVVTFSSAQGDATRVGLEALVPLEESTAREE